MTFHDPLFLGAGAALAALAAVALWSRARRQGRLGAAFGGPRAARRLTGSDLRGIRPGRLGLLALAALALGGALAGPAWSGAEPDPPPPPPVRSVVLALDVSMSMQADDVAPTRLARAAEVAGELLDTLAGDRVGLVLFAGNAYPIAPPTHDHGALRYYLDGVTPTVASAYDPGTLVSVAIRESLALLTREDPGAADPSDAASAGDAGSNPDAARGERAIVLIGDGGSGEPDAEVAAAVGAAADEAVRVHAIGVGTPAGGRMVVPEAPYQIARPVVDQGGAPAVAVLDEAALARISEEGRGRHALAEDAGGMRAVHEALSRPARPAEPHEASPLRDRYDPGVWLAAAVLFFLLLESLLDVRLPRRLLSLVRRPA